MYLVLLCHGQVRDVTSAQSARLVTAKSSADYGKRLAFGELVSRDRVQYGYRGESQSDVIWAARDD